MLPPSSDYVHVTLHKLLVHISLTINHQYFSLKLLLGWQKLALSEIYTVVHLEKVMVYVWTKNRQ